MSSGPMTHRGLADRTRPTCRGTKKDGTPCNATECSDGFCSIHHPDRRRYNNPGRPKEKGQTLGLKAPKTPDEIKEFLSNCMVAAADRLRFKDVGDLARVLKQFHKLDSSGSDDDIDSMSFSELQEQLRDASGGAQP